MIITFIYNFYCIIRTVIITPWINCAGSIGIAGTIDVESQIRMVITPYAIQAVSSIDCLNILSLRVVSRVRPHTNSITGLHNRCGVLNI